VEGFFQSNEIYKGVFVAPLSHGEVLQIVSNLPHFEGGVATRDSSIPAVMFVDLVPQGI
jgi:hypothetical protein